MIEWIEFRNFKALRNAKLPLSQFTLIVGPNGSGKSTALQSVLYLNDPGRTDFDQIRTSGPFGGDLTEMGAKWAEGQKEAVVEVQWSRAFTRGHLIPGGNHDAREKAMTAIRRARLFSLEAPAISAPVVIQPNIEVEPNGGNLAGVLDLLHTQDEERFEALNRELMTWIPEFDRILFETPQSGQRSIALRTRQGRYAIKARDLSQGTLVALALLTIAYLPEPRRYSTASSPSRTT